MQTIEIQFLFILLHLLLQEVLGEYGVNGLVPLRYTVLKLNFSKLSLEVRQC